MCFCLENSASAIVLPQSFTARQINVPKVLILESKQATLKFLGLKLPYLILFHSVSYRLLDELTLLVFQILIKELFSGRYAFTLNVHILGRAKFRAQQKC